MKTDYILDTLRTRPRLELDLADLDSPYEIIERAKPRRYRHYLYRIRFKNLVLKYGMSSDTQGKPLERVYRQIGHCQSWGTKQLAGACGADWLMIEQLADRELGIKTIDHRQLTVTVWDFTNWDFDLINRRLELLQMEQALIQAHSDLVGAKPIGNLQADEYLQHRTGITRTVWDSLFLG